MSTVEPRLLGQVFWSLLGFLIAAGVAAGLTSVPGSASWGEVEFEPDVAVAVVVEEAPAVGERVHECDAPVRGAIDAMGLKQFERVEALTGITDLNADGLIVVVDHEFELLPGGQAGVANDIADELCRQQLGDELEVAVVGERPDLLDRPAGLAGRAHGCPKSEAELLLLGVGVCHRQGCHLPERRRLRSARRYPSGRWQNGYNGRTDGRT